MENPSTRIQKADFPRLHQLRSRTEGLLGDQPAIVTRNSRPGSSLPRKVL